MHDDAAANVDRQRRGSSTAPSLGATTPGLPKTLHAAHAATQLGRRGLSAQRPILDALDARGPAFPQGIRADSIVGGKRLAEIRAVDRGSSCSQETPACVPGCLRPPDREATRRLAALRRGPERAGRRAKRLRRIRNWPSAAGARARIGTERTRPSGIGAGCESLGWRGPMRSVRQPTAVVPHPRKFRRPRVEGTGVGWTAKRGRQQARSPIAFTDRSRPASRGPATRRRRRRRHRTGPNRRPSTRSRRPDAGCAPPSSPPAENARPR